VVADEKEVHMRIVMNRMGRGCLLVAWLAGGLAMADTNGVTELEQVNQAIQGIEANLIKLQGDRIRARHELEYGDTAASARYQEARQMEKELAELRKQLDVRLLAADPGIGEDERQIKELNARIRESHLLAAAIGRELSTAGHQGADSNLVASLEAEQAQSQLDTRALESQLQEAIAALTGRREAAAAADPETQRLHGEWTALQARYEEAFGALRQMTDTSDAVQAIDARRQALGAELQRLQERRNQLREAALPP
jgi:chromosome segregation ATPase